MGKTLLVVHGSKSSCLKQGCKFLARVAGTRPYSLFVVLGGVYICFLEYVCIYVCIYECVCIYIYIIYPDVGGGGAEL